jgi:hypothetical protein
MPRIPDPALRALFEHPDLSLAAKGALAVILTRPSGARVSPEYLFSSSGDPMTVVSKAVPELARTGLVGTARPAGRRQGQVALMAIVRTVALVANKGVERCWAYELACDSQVDLTTVRLGVDDTVRVVGSQYARPAAFELAGSGVCPGHLARMSPGMQRRTRLL